MLSKRFCFHCEKFVPYRTYVNHKQRYFDHFSGLWQKDPSLQQSSDEDLLPDLPSDSDMGDVISEEEIQIFQKFLRDQHLHDLAAPNVYQENFEQIFKQSELHNTARNIGQVDCNFALSLLQLREADIITGSKLWFTVREYKCGPPHTVEAFDNDELVYVTRAYRFLVPEIPEGAVPVLFDRYSTVAFAGVLYGSMCSRHKRSGNILAKWAGRYDDEIDPSSDVRPGLVQYFF